VTYPTTIIDNFFDDPDAIVEMAEGMKYYAPDTGNWPGTRTKQLHIENHRFFTYFGQKIHNLFHDSCPETWSLQSHFQNIRPFEDKYSKRNRGWVHQDIDTWFGGVVYLSKNPEPDTGTSIYQAKKGYSLQYIKELQIKQSHYLGEQISDEEYDQAFDAMMEQYTETVTIENVYNRFVLFSSKTHHGVKTFGSKPRLTLNFFGMGMSSIPPLQRSR
jgi:hypothetical protein